MPLSVSVMCEPHPVYHDVLNAACAIKCAMNEVHLPDSGFWSKIFREDFLPFACLYCGKIVIKLSVLTICKFRGIKRIHTIAQPPPVSRTFSTSQTETLSPWMLAVSSSQTETLSPWMLAALPQAQPLAPPPTLCLLGPDSSGDLRTGVRQCLSFRVWLISWLCPQGSCMM